MGSPLRFGVHFPSCSNPKARLDDYENNSAYPDGNEKCPEGWLHHPHLFYEVYWSTMDFAGQWETGKTEQPFVLANGDSTGYGLHGDFFNGWDKAALQQIIDHCNTGDGGMDGCPVGGGLQASDKYTDDEYRSIAEKCTVKPHNPEKVLGVLDALPGCNPVIKAGPDASKTPSCPGGQTQDVASTEPEPVKETTLKEPVKPVAQPVPVKQSAPIKESARDVHSTTTTTTTGNAPAGWSYVGCFADTKGTRALPGPNENRMGGGMGDGSLMTISVCAAFCEKHGYEVAGLEWKSECYCGRDVPSTKSDKCTAPCVGDKSQMCGGGDALSVYKKGTGANMVKRHAAAHMARHRVHARSMA